MENALIVLYQMYGLFNFSWNDGSALGSGSDFETVIMESPFD